MGELARDRMGPLPRLRYPNFQSAAVGLCCCQPGADQHLANPSQPAVVFVVSDIEGGEHYVLATSIQFVPSEISVKMSFVVGA
jgi:hypothetical protein